MSEKSVGRTPNSNGGYVAQKAGHQQGNKNGFDRRQGGKHAGQREKFVPNFKKREPTWKRIDAELKELLPKYDEVLFSVYIFFNVNYSIQLLLFGRLED